MDALCIDADTPEKRDRNRMHSSRSHRRSDDECESEYSSNPQLSRRERRKRRRNMLESAYGVSIAEIKEDIAKAVKRRHSIGSLGRASKQRMAKSNSMKGSSHTNTTSSHSQSDNSSGDVSLNNNNHNDTVSTGTASTSVNIPVHPSGLSDLLQIGQIKPNLRDRI